MKNVLSISLISTLLMNSCGYMDDENKSFSKSEQEIIFYEPSGKNFLTLNGRITTYVSSDDYSAALSLFEIFQNLRSSMVLVTRYKSGKTPSGSSKLAASNLLITASHVVTPLIWCPDALCEAPCSPAFVSGARDWVYDEEGAVQKKGVSRG